MSTETKIDLQTFCTTELNGRYPLNEPFHHDEHLCATNDRILVALPAPGAPDSVCEHGGKLPRVMELLEHFDKVSKWRPLPVRAIECADCQGTGFSDRKHFSYDDGKQICGCALLFGKRHVATWLVEKMRPLPGIEWGTIRWDCHIYFRFAQGGRGVVASLEK